MKQLTTHLRFGLLLAALLLWSTSGSTLLAQETEDIRLSAEAGFDGYYKSEHWTPVHVMVANTGPPITGEIRIRRSTTTPGRQLTYSHPIDLPTQSNKRVTLYVRITQPVSDLTVELVEENSRLLAETASNTLSIVDLNTLLYGVVSPNPGELEFLETVTGRRGDGAVAFLNSNDLPELGPAWNALDVLIINDVDTADFTSDQQEALRAWVSTGGQLVLTGGAGWQKTTAAFNDMLPVAVSSTESVDDLPALRGQIGIPFRDPGPYLVSTGSLQQGELLYHQEGLPLLARRTWGQGGVYFLALDPRLAPLADWDGSEVFWQAVASRVPDLSQWATGIQDGNAAATAVSSIPSLTLPDTWQLVLFLFIYVLVVGPTNYLVLKRANRRELAWATVPALVVLFTGAAYLTGFRLKGNNVILNEMAIATGQTNSDQMRVQSIIGLYSPRRGSYDLALPASSMGRPFAPTFGAVDDSGDIDAIVRSDDVVMRNTRVDVAGISTFLADSYQPAPDIRGDAALQIANGPLYAEVTVRNAGDLTLQNATLLLGARAVHLGNLTPGQTESVTQMIGSSASSGLTLADPSPLLTYAGEILGTADYFNDRQAYPRWQLLQALDRRAGAPIATTGATAGTTTNRNAIWLVGWSNQPQLELSLDRNDFDTLATTLYLLEIPVTSISGAESVTLPPSLLNWRVLAQRGVYEAAISELYLNGGSIELEFRPWPAFQALDANDLTLILQPRGSNSQPPPLVSLWNWQEQGWVELAQVQWGETAVANPTPYLSPDNAVRLRLEDRSSGTAIRVVYPRLTGTLR